MNKTPISALQELMAVRKLPLPIYIEEGSCTSFRCTVRVQGITAVGYGTSKKIAKQQSAQNALRKLKFGPMPAQKPPINYVGELNELSSTKGVQYPVYEDVSTTLQTEFIVKCSFLGQQVIGWGFSKKDAKQDAARNMLLRIGGGSVGVYNPRLNDRDVISMFDKLSVKTN